MLNPKPLNPKPLNPKAVDNMYGLDPVRSGRPRSTERVRTVRYPCIPEILGHLM